jgi:ATP-dependent DNA helicase RecG
VQDREERISSVRNATLIKLLEDVPLPGETRTVCENRDSGIRSMLDALLTAGMSPPQFEDRISSFKVTFPNHTLLSEETPRWITGLGEHELTDSQCVALAMLRDILSRAELAARTGLNEQTVRRWLTIMREEGTVELVASSPRSTRARYRRARQGALFPKDKPGETPASPRT